MKFLLFLLTLASTDLFALIHNEELNASIQSVLQDNILVLNRGREDGIRLRDHIKIISIQSGFSARGLAIKTTPTHSHWKIYRVIRPATLSKDLEYKIISMNQYKVPEEFDYYRSKEFLTEYHNERREKLLKAASAQKDLPQNFTIHDLPEDIPSDEIYDDRNFFEKNFSKSQWAKDFENTRFSVYFSPIQFEKVNNVKDINVGFEVGNDYAEKYELALGANFNINDQKDTFSGDEFSTQNTNAYINFDINKITKHWNYFLLGTYDRQKFNKIYPVRHQIRAGFLGFKYDFYEGEKLEDLSLSYIPLFERRVEQSREYIEATDSLEVVETTRTSLRHSFRARMIWHLSDRVSLKNIFYWRPAQDTKTGKIDFRNVDLNNTFEFDFRITDNIYLEYLNIHTWDTRLGNQGFISTNNIHQINLRFNFNI